VSSASTLVGAVARAAGVAGVAGVTGVMAREAEDEGDGASLGAATRGERRCRWWWSGEEMYQASELPSCPGVRSPKQEEQPPARLGARLPKRERGTGAP
jgi:hypothetical protein